MSDLPLNEEGEEELPPLAASTIVYLGPVSPHWEIRADSGDTKLVDDFRTRVNARLMLLPPHDPQFRRNKERVARDAERERIDLTWDLGDDPNTEDTSTRPLAPS